MELLPLVIFFLCVIVAGLLWLLCTLSDKPPHRKHDEPPYWRKHHDPD